MTLMRRIVLSLMSTLTVVVLLFGYRTSTSATMAADQSAVTPISGGGQAAAAPPEGGSDSGDSGDSGDSADSADSSDDSSGGTASDAPQAATGGSSGSSSSSTKTYTGDVAQTRWGPVQVAITVASGKITEVAVPQYPNGNPKDAQINAYALPILIQETTAQQSAQIDMISGATVTSEGYLASLQSALDQAGL